MKKIGPFVHRSLKAKSFEGKQPVRTWSRASTILPYIIKRGVAVHNGRVFVEVYITDDIVGYRLGEFVRTRKRGLDPRSKAKRIRRF